MPYVARGRDGAILAVFKAANDCAHEELKPDDRELRAFLGLPMSVPKTRPQILVDSARHHQLRRTDLEFVRVLDDLLSALLNKGTILVTDLPTEARRKLMLRRSLRRNANDSGGFVAEADELNLS